jgi:transmembrane sensor
MNDKQIHKEHKLLKEVAHMYSAKTEEAWGAFQEKISRNKIQDKKVSTRIFLIRIAAACIILLGVGWVISFWLQSRPHTVQTTWSQKKVPLPDGSTVFLNGHSTLTYPRHFRGKKRTVSLRGEAFFYVTKNKKHPFVVKTNAARIQVLGTSFNVNAPKGKDKVEVLVKTGVVGLSSAESNTKSVILKPGEFGMLKGSHVTKSAIPNVNYLSWRTKTFRFEKTELGKVISTLNHAYAQQIELSSDSIRQLPLTSTYDSVKLDTLLASICLTFHLERVSSGRKIILRPKK